MLCVANEDAEPPELHADAERRTIVGFIAALRIRS